MILRLNIHYYHNRRYKSYISSLKAVILRILHFDFFMIKYSKFTDNIGSGNFTGKFQKSVLGRGGVTPPPPHAPLPPLLGTPLQLLLRYLAMEVEQIFMKQSFLVCKRKRLNTISETKPNIVHLTLNYFNVLPATKPRSDCKIARLGLPEFAELPFADFV